MAENVQFDDDESSRVGRNDNVRANVFSTPAPQRRICHVTD